MLKNTVAPLRVGIYHRIAHKDVFSVCSNELLKEQWRREIGQNENMIIAEFYFDDSPVGTEKTPEHDRLLTDCRAGKIDMVMTRSIRRFCPTYRLLMDAICEMNSLTPPVEVYFMHEQVHSTDVDGEYLQQLLKDGDST